MAKVEHPFDEAFEDGEITLEQIAGLYGGTYNGVTKIKCPAHREETPSCTVNEGPQGKMEFHCGDNCKSELIEWQIRRDFGIDRALREISTLILKADVKNSQIGLNKYVEEITSDRKKLNGPRFRQKCMILWARQYILRRIYGHEPAFMIDEVIKTRTRRTFEPALMEETDDKH